jgi:toxin ParE1/3/4
MTRRVVRPQVVDDDLNEIASYIWDRNPESAVRFLDGMEDAFNKLADMPTLGSRWPTANRRLKGLRTWTLRKFRRYVIFYHELSDGIAVVRVLDGSRNLRKLLEAD